MKLRGLTKAPIARGTRVIVRVDADVSVAKGIITEESKFRLDSAIPTLKYLYKKGAIVTVIGHRGRPNGVVVSSLSLKPVQKYFEEKLKQPVRVLPNLRFDAREEKNDRVFARELAENQDIFVNESFGTAHRKHASTHAITRFLPSYAGIHFEKECLELERALHPKKPLAVIIGGSKLETKLPILKKFLPHATHVFVVGAGANAFFSACGYDVGGSVVHEASVHIARGLLGKKNMPAPIDVVVGSVGSSKKSRIVAIEDILQGRICGEKEAILDIGPESCEFMSELLQDMKTIIWNGPAGYIERAPFERGTEYIARSLSRMGRNGVQVYAGGGETIQSIMATRTSSGFRHVSTGGGAMLQFLSGASLPAIEVLLSKK